MEQNKRLRLAFLLIILTALGVLTPSLMHNSFAGDRFLRGKDNGQAPEKQHMNYNGDERTYYVYVPVRVKPQSGKVPMVMMLHGGGGDGRSAIKMSDFFAKADMEGFIVVYPEGSGRRARSKLKTWNAKHCCGPAMENNVDDVGFFSALIDKLVTEYPVDTKRIYATGMSNGAMMSHRLGAELSNKIAAIAPVVGGMFGDEQYPSHPVSAIIINGKLDESVPIEGGENGGRFADAWDGTLLKPAKYQGEFWAKVNGCGSEPVKQRFNANLYAWRYDCPAGLDVIHYIVEDGGHQYPGGQRGSTLGDKPSNAMNATDVIWAFFSQHHK